MKIKQASMCDFEKIISFYNVMCAVLGEKDFLPDGNKGGFPSQDMVRDAIYSGSQFIGVENDKIVAAYIMNHDWNTMSCKSTETGCVSARSMRTDTPA